MIERRLTSDVELKDKYTKVGVVILIFDNEGKLLTIRENQNDDGAVKKAGDLGVVCETSEPGEAWQVTVLRGIKEELGLNEVDIAKSIKMDPDQNFLGECVFVDGVLARVVAFVGDNKNIVPESAESCKEVSLVGWKSMEELLEADNLRLGVRNVLNSLIDSKQNYLATEKPTKYLVPLTLDNLKMFSEQQ
jgi:hypothetical protein